MLLVNWHALKQAGCCVCQSPGDQHARGPAIEQHIRNSHDGLEVCDASPRSAHLGNHAYLSCCDSGAAGKKLAVTADTYARLRRQRMKWCIRRVEALIVLHVLLRVSNRARFADSSSIRRNSTNCCELGFDRRHSCRGCTGSHTP
jgi:hypothetical protein